MAEYTDHSLFGSSYDVLGRFQKNRDAGQRFFGLGPDSQKGGEANYIQDYWLYDLASARRPWPDSPFRARLSQRYVASRILNGPIPGLPTFATAVPPAVRGARPADRRDAASTLDYDTRDHAVTTTRASTRSLRREVGARLPEPVRLRALRGRGAMVRGGPGAPGAGLRVQGRFEQLLGPTPPFWILPSLGGKYSLRAYGDGRYIARGTRRSTSRTASDGTRRAPPASRPRSSSRRSSASARLRQPRGRAGPDIRPVFGAAVRAVARPQGWSGLRRLRHRP